MTINALPPAPSTSDPANFATKADALIAALPAFVTEANALAVAMNLNSTTDTSASSVAIGTGTKNFTVSTGKSFQPGMYLMIADTAAPSTNWMLGQITSYVTGTGALVMNVTTIGGTGTKTAWLISQSTAFTVATNDAATLSLASASTVNIGAAASVNIEISGTTPVTAFDTITEGVTRRVTYTGAVPVTYNATSMQLLGGASRTHSVGDVSFFRSLGGGNWVEEFFQPIAGYPMNTGVRQIVLSGPYDTSGNSTFLPSTSANLNLTSQNISASFPLIVSAMAGFDMAGPKNTIGKSVANLTWTGLTNNTENYLYVTIGANGALTTGFTTLAPVIQPSGTPATTSGQITVNTVDGKVYLGNGSTAPAVNLVVVGRATTSGGTVTATSSSYYSGQVNPIILAFTATNSAWLPNVATKRMSGYGIGGGSAGYGQAANQTFRQICGIKGHTSLLFHSTSVSGAYVITVGAGGTGGTGAGPAGGDSSVSGTGLAFTAKGGASVGLTASTDYPTLSSQGAAEDQTPDGAATLVVADPGNGTAGAANTGRAGTGSFSTASGSRTGGNGGSGVIFINEYI